MQGVFVLVAAAGAAYFAFAKRRFDFLSLGYVSALVYFLPGFAGFTRMPQTVFSAFREPVPLIEETYWVFILVLGALAVTAVVTDRLPVREFPRFKIPAPHLALSILLALTLLGFGGTVLSAGRLLLADEKHMIVASVGRWRILWVNGAALGALLAFSLRKWWILAGCMVLLLADLYVGFRNNLALTTISLFLLWLTAKGEQRLALRNLRAGLAAAAAAVVFFAYKFLYVPIKQGNWSELTYRLTDWGYISRGLSHSEPFVTQTILNEVLTRRFQVGLEGFGQVFFNLVPFAPAFGLKATPISARFREELFPGTPGGLGSNIWAEMWSRGGWPLLFLFAMAFALSLFLASEALRCRDPLVLPMVALNGSYWAFYIHRNTLTYQVNLHKRLLLLWLIAAAVGVLMVALRRTAPPGKHDNLES